VTPIGENVSLQDIIKTAYWDRLLVAPELLPGPPLLDGGYVDADFLLTA
jgi:hypothetical protein